VPSTVYCSILKNLVNVTEQFFYTMLRHFLVCCSSHCCILQLTSGHRTVILSAMEKIVKQKIDEVDNELVLDTIRQASAELTVSKVTVIFTSLHVVMCV